MYKFIFNFIATDSIAKRGTQRAFFSSFYRHMIRAEYVKVHGETRVCEHVHIDYVFNSLYEKIIRCLVIYVRTLPILFAFSISVYTR